MLTQDWKLENLFVAIRTLYDFPGGIFSVSSMDRFLISGQKALTECYYCHVIINFSLEKLLIFAPFPG